MKGSELPEPTADEAHSGFVEWLVTGLYGQRRRSLSHLVGVDRTRCGVPIPDHLPSCARTSNPLLRGTVCYRCTLSLYRERERLHGEVQRLIGGSR